MGVKLSLRLFGGLSLSPERRGEVPFAAGRTSELLARVVLAGEAGCSRGELAEEFWPGLDPKMSRHRLRQTLVQLRQPLAAARLELESVISVNRNTLWLCPDVRESDVTLYSAALRGGDLRSAAAIYRGDLMPGSDNPVISRERERLRVSYLGVLRTLAAEHEGNGDLPSALDAATRLAVLEPEDENTSLLLIRLLLETGSTETARRRYRKLRRELKAPNGGTLLEPHLRREVRQWFASAARRIAPNSFVRSSETTDSPHVHVNLPPTRTRFFGREQELATVARLLAQIDVQSITLVGPAGVGKTRLALEAAAGMRDRHPYFVSLSEIDDAHLIGDKILQSLDRQPKGPRSPLEQAIAELERPARPVLLILDNLEHLQEQAETARTIETLLHRLPNIKCLVTSRQLLEARGATVVTVEPLPVLPVQDAVTPERLAETASASLLVDRLQSVRPDFRVTERNADALATLCRQLDGLPLALEIAATWARTLSPAEIVTHLGKSERRRSLLTSRQIPDNARHASLQRAIAWSYGRLPADLQRFYTRLHVFHGSFTEEAAAAVCEEPQAMDLLAELEERSFVIAFEAAERMRYRLLETMREFGREQVDSEEQARLARRHAAHYLEFAESRHPGVPGSVRNEQLQAEIDNLRVALATCERLALTGEPELLPRLALALHWFWILRGHRREGQIWTQRAADFFPSLDEALSDASICSDRLIAQAKVWQAMAALLESQSDSTRIYQLHKGARDLYKHSGNAKQEAQALNFLGSISLQSGRYREAYDWMRESLALSNTLNDTLNAAVALHYLGMIHDQWCEYDEAERLFAEAASHYGSTANPAVCTSQAVAAWHRGDLERARALFLKALSLRRAQGFVSGASFCQTALGNVASMQSDHPAALDLHQSAVAVIDESEEPRAFAMAIGYRGIAFLRTGDYVSADIDLSHALRLRREVGDRWGIAHALEHQAILACVARADWHGAVALWAEADAIRTELGSPLPPVERPWHEEWQAKACAALGAELFQELWRCTQSL